MSDLSQTVRRIADELKKNHEVDDKGVIKYPEASKAYESALPEGLTLDQVKQSQLFLIDACAGTHLATGELSTPLLKNGVKNVRTKTTLGYSAIESKHSQPRSGVTNGHAWTNNNPSTVELIVGHGSKSKPFKQVQDHLSELKNKAFGS